MLAGLIFLGHRHAAWTKTRSCRQAKEQICLSKALPTGVPVREPVGGADGWQVISKPQFEAEEQSLQSDGKDARILSEDDPDCVDPNPQAGLLCKAYVGRDHVIAEYGFSNGGTVSCGASYRHEGHPPCDR